MQLADFLPKAFRLMEAQRTTNEPLVLTVNGEPVLVLQSFEGYRELLTNEPPPEEPPIQ